MSSPNPERMAYVREMARCHPELGNRTLARIIYAANRALWSDLECARNCVRVVRGCKGNALRGKTANKELFRSVGVGTVPLPPPIVEDWTPVNLGNDVMAVVLSDLHIPFHDSTAISLAVKYAQKIKPDVVLVNGDMADFYSISRFCKDPSILTLRNELDVVADFLEWLRKQFPKSRIVLKEGNHEERWYAYVWNKAPELELESQSDFWSNALGVEALGMEVVKDKRMILLGKLPVLHGHEFPQGGQSPVNPARGYFMRSLHCCLASHRHQSSQHSAPTLTGEILTTFSTGCLCNLHPKYSRINTWNHGFAVVEVDKKGSWQVGNFRIVNGEVYS